MRETVFVVDFKYSAYTTPIGQKNVDDRFGEVRHGESNTNNPSAPTQIFLPLIYFSARNCIASN